jgi:hypothetical protein
MAPALKPPGICDGWGGMRADAPPWSGGGIGAARMLLSSPSAPKPRFRNMVFQYVVSVSTCLTPGMVGWVYRDVEPE